MPRPSKIHWTHSVGQYGSTVSVYQRRPGDSIEIRYGGRSYSLKHSDRDAALEKAYRIHKAIRHGLEARDAGLTTLGQVFETWKRQKLSTRSKRRQPSDLRRIELFTAYFGGTTPAVRLSLREWENFIDDRRSGRIDGRGNTNPEPISTKLVVLPRTVEADLVWLQTVFSWAARYRLPDGSYLLPDNPARGFPMPVVRDKRQPVSDPDRFALTLGASEGIGYLAEILCVVAGTGRRISSVLDLQHGDLDLAKDAPGTVRWRGEKDKAGRTATTPILPDVRAVFDAIRVERPGVGSVYLWPSPSSKKRPVSRYLAHEWLLRAEERAGLPKLDGGAWHPYKRLFVTSYAATVSLPMIAAMTGNSDLRNLAASYLKPGPQAVYEAFQGGPNLTENADEVASGET